MEVPFLEFDGTFIPDKNCGCKPKSSCTKKANFQVGKTYKKRRWDVKNGNQLTLKKVPHTFDHLTPPICACRSKQHDQQFCIWHNHKNHPFVFHSYILYAFRIIKKLCYELRTILSVPFTQRMELWNCVYNLFSQLIFTIYIFHA